jgi:hypothetical protein
MPANVNHLQLEQLAELGRRPKRVRHGLLVDVDRRRRDELAADLGEQEPPLGQRPAVERGQALERGPVAHSAVPDQERPREFRLERSRLVPAENPTG